MLRVFRVVLWCRFFVRGFLLSVCVLMCRRCFVGVVMKFGKLKSIDVYG